VDKLLKGSLAAVVIATVAVESAMDERFRDPPKVPTVGAPYKNIGKRVLIIGAALPVTRRRKPCASSLAGAKWRERIASLTRQVAVKLASIA
jgi:hypothetical protein